MNIKQCENKNAYAINFGAKLEIDGYTEDISSKQLNAWTKKAKSIGCENDIIKLTFDEPMTHSANPTSKYNPERLKKSKQPNKNSFILKRNIDCTIIKENGEELKKTPFSYFGKFSNDINKNKQKNIQKKYTEQIVSKYLNILKNILNK